MQLRLSLPFCAAAGVARWNWASAECCTHAACLVPCEASQPVPPGLVSGVFGPEGRTGGGLVGTWGSVLLWLCRLGVFLVVQGALVRCWARALI